MFVRMARFESVDPEAFRGQVDDIRRHVTAAQAAAGRSMRELDEAAVEDLAGLPMPLRLSVRRLVALVDGEAGTAIIAVFCESEEDLRSVDVALGRFPLPRGVGVRTGVETYRVALDEDLSPSFASGEFG